MNLTSTHSFIWCVDSEPQHSRAMFSLRRIAAQGSPAKQAHRLLARAGYSTVPANNPNPPKPVQNVSETNALPTTSTGNIDAALQESAEEGERQRVRQAPNRDRIWSTSQQERSKAMVGPRFEQTIMEYQVSLVNWIFQQC